MNFGPPCHIEEHSAEGRDCPVPEIGVGDGETVGDVELLGEGVVDEEVEEDHADDGQRHPEVTQRAPHGAAQVLQGVDSMGYFDHIKNGLGRNISSHASHFHPVVFNIFFMFAFRLAVLRDQWSEARQ